jgi:hypothetical protein
MSYEQVNHPQHYQHPSGVECITVVEHCNFCVGNAIKYLWRAGQKPGVDTIIDLRKAIFYINREIERLQKMEKQNAKPAG